MFREISRRKQNATEGNSVFAAEASAFLKPESEQLRVQKANLLFSSPIFLVIVLYFLARLLSYYLSDYGATTAGICLLVVYYAFLLLVSREYTPPPSVQAAPVPMSPSPAESFKTPPPMRRRLVMDAMGAMTRSRPEPIPCTEWLCFGMIILSSVLLIVPFLNGVSLYDLTVSDWVICAIYAFLNPMVEERYWRRLLFATVLGRSVKQDPTTLRAEAAASWLMSPGETPVMRKRASRRRGSQGKVPRLAPTTVLLVAATIGYSAVLHTALQYFVFGHFSSSMRSTDRIVIGVVYNCIWGTVSALCGSDGYATWGHRIFDFLMLTPVVFMSWDRPFYGV